MNSPLDITNTRTSRYLYIERILVLYSSLVCNLFRNRIFYGQKLKTFLQRKGETIYMPNLVYHSVWNISPTISVGNNPLYQSSFVEHLGSGGAGFDLKKEIRTLKNSAVSDVSNQINDAIRSQNILNFSTPQFNIRYDNFCRAI